MVDPDVTTSWTVVPPAVDEGLHLGATAGLRAGLYSRGQVDFDLPDFVGDFADVGGPSRRVPGQPEARQRPMGRFGVPVGFLGRTARGARVALPVLVYALTFGLGSWAAHLIVFRRTRAWRHAAAAAFHLVTVAVACVLIPTDGGFYALMWIMLVNYIGGGVVLGEQLYPAPRRAPAPADAHIAAPPLEPWTREWIRLRVSLWWQALLILPFGFGTALALLFAGILARQPGWWALIPCTQPQRSERSLS